MPSQIAIWNRALSRLSVPLISAVDEGSPASDACAAAWEMVLEEVSRAHPWNCLLTRAELAAAATDPIFGYDYAYPLPADCLRVISTDTSDPWVVESRSVLTDASAPLYVTYVRREDDTEQYDAGFASVLAQRLAVELSQQLTSASATRQGELMLIYERLLAQARGMDALEGSPQDLQTDDWILVRL